MLRNHTPNDAYKNMYPLKTQNTASPYTQQFYPTETLYLPGCITQGAVLRIIKETHNIKLTVHKYFFRNGMLQGSTRSFLTFSS
jgi:hypothetical protein